MWTTRDERELLAVPWSEYLRRYKRKGEKHHPKLAYLEGTLEVMSPSNEHEVIAQLINRMVDLYRLARDQPYLATGSWTIKSARYRVAVEPDCSFIFEDLEQETRPDLAVEVQWTYGGLEKLEIYRKLGVPEVWFWKDRQIEIYVLGRAGYRRRARSKFLPEIDLEDICKFAERRHDPLALWKDYKRRVRRSR